MQHRLLVIVRMYTMMLMTTVGSLVKVIQIRVRQTRAAQEKKNALEVISYRG